MRIKHVLIRNFMSIQNVDFEVPEAGLHFVSGEITKSDERPDGSIVVKVEVGGVKRR